MRETAFEFWANTKSYPVYDGNIKDRRLHELLWLIPQIKNMRSILDLGCGDGSLIRCLRELTGIEKFYAFDMSAKLLEQINFSSDVEVQEFDIYSPRDLPVTDAVIMGGVIPYVFEDDILNKFLSCIKTKLFLRAPCSDTEQYVNTYSEALEANYASKYRTVDKVVELLSINFEVLDVARVYPNHLESRFGTKQFYFTAEPRTQHVTS